ncbi:MULTISPECIES: sensor histidine kinase [unclassified Janthinobacterium]|uniref:sensor histidine kinase n=1 Tax=unclassified Janthinobacterium TaxID=2610881 RepID=UPI00034B33B7|nr:MULTISPECIES: histidine kinase [unclassified Janthinobacterium]MEC5162634.1 two-component system sensor histidine kinase AlgZ [Janthinobacterium sp. CG_S6]
MNPPPISNPTVALAAWRSRIHTILTNVLAWTGICAAGALASYNDHVRAGAPESYLNYFERWWVFHVPMMIFSAGLSLALTRWPALFDSKRRATLIYAGLLLLFLPGEWLFVAAVSLHNKGGGVTLDSAWQALLGMSKFDGFTEFAWMTGTFLAMVAMGNWRRAKARELAWQRSQTDNLNLHLALEQQRMLSLRAQLEPHFIFNALNAISALVRTGDKSVALTGISRLSDLLRYALSASLRDTVTIAEELQFVRDYLALQALRYGERLQFHIEGDDDVVQGGDCPPLLLQPLIENALRHDLDCHGGSSDIRLSFARSGKDVLISVSNPVSRHVSPNPGMGLGLRNTRLRLKLSSAAASLHTELRAERFLVEIRMPLTVAD